MFFRSATPISPCFRTPHKKISQKLNTKYFIKQKALPQRTDNLWSFYINSFALVTMPNILQIFQIWQFNAYKKHAYVWEQKSPFATWTIILPLLYKQSTIFSLVKGSNFIAFAICRSKVKIANMHMATESSFSNFKNILSIIKRNQLHWSNSLYYLRSRILLKSKSYAYFS